MKWNTGDWVGNFDGERETIIAHGFPCKVPELIGGLLLIGGGIYTIMRGSFKAGGVGYNRGEYDALKKLNLFVDDSNSEGARTGPLSFYISINPTQKEKSK